MRKQARSNRTIVRPTPAVQNTICVITRNLIALTITDNNPFAALVCSTERVRGRFRKYWNASGNKYVAVQEIPFVPFWPFPGKHFTCNLVLTTSKHGH